MKRLMLLLLTLALLLPCCLSAAEEHLTQRQVVETVLVPLALANDDGALVTEEFSAGDLAAILQALRDNGHEVDARLDWLSRIGEGYWEEETLMAICRKAFGGLIMDWTPQEQHWFGDMCVAIRFSTENDFPTGEEASMSREEALNRAVECLSAAYGAGETLPLTDESLYRIGAALQGHEEDEELGIYWYFSFSPRTLEGVSYTISLNSEGAPIDMSGAASGGLPDGYTITQLISALNNLYYRQYHSQYDWPQEAWTLFDTLLDDADDSEILYHPEYKAYLEAVYPAADTAALSREEAVQLAAQALGIDIPWTVSAVLTSAGEPVWKVCLEDASHDNWLAEIDASDGHTVWTSPLKGHEAWAAWVPHECYASAMGGTLDLAAAVQRAEEAIRALTGVDSLPLSDEDCFTVFGVHQQQRGLWILRFNSKRMEWGSGEISIEDQTGEVLTWNITGMTDPVDGDNLLTRYRNVYGWWGDWDQATWVALGEEERGFTPQTQTGRLIARSEYLPESEAAITREEAIRIATEADSPSGAYNEANSCVLLGSGGYPVWKIRMLYGETPGTTLYEIDGMTGRVLDVQKFITDNPEVNPTCMIFTLRTTFSRDLLETRGEAGALWLAQDAITKAYSDLEYDDPSITLDAANYEISITHGDGWTVEAVSRTDGDSYRVTLNEDGIPQTVERLDGNS